MILITYILFSLPVWVILVAVGGGCALIAVIVALILVRRQRSNVMVSFSQHLSIVAKNLHLLYANYKGADQAAQIRDSDHDPRV